MKVWTLLAFVGLHWPFWPLWPWRIFLKQKLAFMIKIKHNWPVSNNHFSKSISEGGWAFQITVAMYLRFFILRIQPPYRNMRYVSTWWLWCGGRSKLVELLLWHTWISHCKFWQITNYICHPPLFQVICCERCNHTNWNCFIFKIIILPSLWLQGFPN